MADDSRWRPGKPLRIIPIGDVATASEWIPFARRKMVELSRSGDYARRTWMPAPGVVIRGETLRDIPRVFIEVEGYEYIVIGDIFGGSGDVRGLHGGKFGYDKISKKINDWLGTDWSSFGRVDAYLVGKNLLPIGGGVFLTDYNKDEPAPIHCAVIAVTGSTAAIRLLARADAADYSVFSIVNANYGGRLTLPDDTVLPRYEYVSWGGKNQATTIDPVEVGSYSGIIPYAPLQASRSSSPTPYTLYKSAVAYTSTKPLGSALSVGGFTGNIGDAPVPVYSASYPIKTAYEWANERNILVVSAPTHWEPTGQTKIVTIPNEPPRTIYEFKPTATQIAAAVAAMPAILDGGASFDAAWYAGFANYNWRLGLDISITSEKVVTPAPELQPETQRLATETVIFSVKLIERLRYISQDPTTKLKYIPPDIGAAVGSIRWWSWHPTVFDLFPGLPYNYAGPELEYTPIGLEVTDSYKGNVSGYDRIFTLVDPSYDFDGRYDITVAGTSNDPVSARVSPTDIAILFTTSIKTIARQLHEHDAGYTGFFFEYYNSPGFATPDQSNVYTIISITSNDDGMSWHANVTQSPPNKPGFTWLTYAGNDTLLAFANVQGGYEVWRSTDKGVTYNPCHTTTDFDFNSSYATCLDVGVVGFYAWGSEGGVFWRTLDFGSTWQAFSIPVIDPEHPELGGGYEYPFVQFNNRVTIVSKGETYETTTLALTIWHPTPDNPFVRETRVFLSKDGGATWHEDAQLQPSLSGVNVGPVRPNVKANCGVPGYLDPPP